jgi:hypothetical protein
VRGAVLRPKPSRNAYAEPAKTNPTLANFPLAALPADPNLSIERQPRAPRLGEFRLGPVQAGAACLFTGEVLLLFGGEGLASRAGLRVNKCLGVVHRSFPFGERHVSLMRVSHKRATASSGDEP